MAKITVSEQGENSSNIFYLQSEICELFTERENKILNTNFADRNFLTITVVDDIYKIIKEEICDKIAEIIVINYKYIFLKNNVDICGLKEVEKELLYTSLIAADFDDDKKYVYDRIKNDDILQIDGIYNFKLKQLKRKWEEVVAYIPPCFVNSQLKEFVTYLINNKSKKTYIDNGRVYDSHYRRLNRSELLNGIEEVKITREVLLSNCGLISLNGSIPKDDEYYLNEFFSDRITFCNGYFY